MPAYNEAIRIGDTVETLRVRVPAFAPDCEIRVVDDGSEDETTAIVESIAKRDT